MRLSGRVSSHVAPTPIPPGVLYHDVIVAVAYCPRISGAPGHLVQVYIVI
jgi:hypothetical protein